MYGQMLVLKTHLKLQNPVEFLQISVDEKSAARYSSRIHLLMNQGELFIGHGRKGRSGAHMFLL